MCVEDGAGFEGYLSAGEEEACLGGWLVRGETTRATGSWGCGGVGGGREDEESVDVVADCEGEVEEGEGWTREEGVYCWW